MRLVKTFYFYRERRGRGLRGRRRHSLHTSDVVGARIPSAQSPRAARMHAF